MTRKLPPAIPDPPEIPRRWFYLGVMRDPFDAIKCDLLRSARGHFFKAPLPEQLDFLGVDK